MPAITPKQLALLTIVAAGPRSVPDLNDLGVHILTRRSCRRRNLVTVLQVEDGPIGWGLGLSDDGKRAFQHANRQRKA